MIHKGNHMKMNKLHATTCNNTEKITQLQSHNGRNQTYLTWWSYGVEQCPPKIHVYSEMRLYRYK